MSRVFGVVLCGGVVLLVCWWSIFRKRPFMEWVGLVVFVLFGFVSLLGCVWWCDKGAGAIF